MKRSQSLLIGSFYFDPPIFSRTPHHIKGGFYNVGVKTFHFENK
jgi:hypothetical protein